MAQGRHNRKRKKVKQYQLFILLVLLFTWTPWFIALQTGLPFDAALVKGLLATGLLGPAITTYLILQNQSATARKNFRERLLSFRLIRVSGYLFIFLVPLGLPVLSVLVSTLAGHALNQLNVSEAVTGNGPALLTFLLYTFLIGPLPEEIGWRGFLLDSLRNRHTGLQSSLIMAAVWGVWHVPLFFVPGYPLQAYGANPLLLITFFADLFPLCILYTWLYYANHRSILAAILLHFMLNFAGTVLTIDPLTEIIQFFLLLLLALFLVTRNPKIFLYSRKTYLSGRRQV